MLVLMSSMPSTSRSEGSAQREQLQMREVPCHLTTLPLSSRRHRETCRDSCAVPSAGRCRHQRDDVCIQDKSRTLRLLRLRPLPGASGGGVELVGGGERETGPSGGVFRGHGAPPGAQPLSSGRNWNQNATYTVFGVSGDTMFLISEYGMCWLHLWRCGTALLDAQVADILHE